MIIHRKILLLLVGLCFIAVVSAFGVQGKWRAATEKELASLLPTRAPVEKEQIETEMRTASGITDGKGRFFAAVVIITAGYAAEGKYSHFLTTQVPLKIGAMTLQPGEYVFGQKRVDANTIEVKFHEAASGKLLGAVNAQRGQSKGAIRSITIAPPKGNTGTIYLGRFAFQYTVSE